MELSIGIRNLHVKEILYEFPLSFVDKKGTKNLRPYPFPHCPFNGSIFLQINKSTFSINSSTLQLIKALVRLAKIEQSED